MLKVIVSAYEVLVIDQHEFLRLRNYDEYGIDFVISVVPCLV